MPTGRPVTPETRALIVAALNRPDPKRNAIARECEVSGAVVTGIAEEEGIAFDRSHSALAIAAAAIDLKAARQAISAQLLVRAQESLEMMDAPTDYFELDRSGSWKVYHADAPTLADRRNLMTIAAIGVQRHAELVRVDATPETTAQESVVATLIGGLEGAAAALRARATAEGLAAAESGQRPTSGGD